MIRVLQIFFVSVILRAIFGNSPLFVCSFRSSTRRVTTMYRANRAISTIGRKNPYLNSPIVTASHVRLFSSKQGPPRQYNESQRFAASPPSSNHAMSSRKNASCASAASKSFLDQVTSESSYIQDGNNPQRKRYRFPMGPQRGQRFPPTESSVSAVTFLGTASCTPSANRGVSSIAFRYNGEVMLFDCGEATQIQFQRAVLRVSKIRRIFLTHNHGDHVFGLPGMLCFLGAATLDERGKLQSEGEQAEPIDIYGPEGIRDMIRAVMQTTHSRVTMPYRVHELKNVPHLHGKYSRPVRLPGINTSFTTMFGERPGGTDIHPDQNGVYHLVDTSELTVKAAAIQHTIPCVGFVIEEKDPVPTLDVDKVAALVEANKEELQKLKVQQGRRASSYKEYYAVLKSLSHDESFTFPDGSVVRGKDIHLPARKGRKVVIMGDTCDGSGIRSIAMDADMLIHEATKAHIPFLTEYSGASAQDVRKEAIFQGHSTPEMAAEFADSIRAKKLVLTHFSPRFHGDSSEPSMRIMWHIEDLARKASRYLKGDDDVVAAWDTLSLEVPAPGGEKE